MSKPKIVRMPKVEYYIRGFAQYLAPRALFSGRAESIIASIPAALRDELEVRADYYCRIRPGATLAGANDLTRIRDFKYPFGQKHHHSTYFLDLYRNLVYFPGDLEFSYLFGDVTHEPGHPTIVKSRPVTDGPTNSVVLKLNAHRHYRFIRGDKPFAQKKSMLVGRHFGTQSQRVSLLRANFGNPLCDIGLTGGEGSENYPEWRVPFMSIPEHLDYKFISCAEGNDVATNLKWVMSSNSIAVMPRPTMETWFMEGILEPDRHFICVADDYSDLTDKITFYAAHPRESQRIIDNAHAHVARFQNPRLEKAIQLRVLQKYFNY